MNTTANLYDSLHRSGVVPLSDLPTVGRALAAADATDVPMVTLSATRSEITWPYICSHCGSEDIRTADADGYPYARGYAHCFACNSEGVPDTSEDYNETSGWVTVDNPWGSLMDDERMLETLPLGDAVDIVRNFPGAVWDYREGESEQNYRTGADVSVTLFADAPDVIRARLFRLVEISD